MGVEVACLRIELGIPSLAIHGRSLGPALDARQDLAVNRLPPDFPRQKVSSRRQ